MRSHGSLQGRASSKLWLALYSSWKVVNFSSLLWGGQEQTFSLRCLYIQMPAAAARSPAPHA